jgi:hypothetical protein
MFTAIHRSSSRAAVPVVLLGSLVFSAAHAAAPGEPQFEIVNTGTDSVDVRATWAAPSRGWVRSYDYLSGRNEGPDFADSGRVSTRSVLLSAVPRGGSYWFCVSANDWRNRAGERACNSFQTPAPETAQPAPALEPEPAPIPTAVTAPAQPGQPQIELLNADAAGADVRVSWSGGDGAESYQYRGGNNLGQNWSVQAQTAQTSVQLNDVPLSGSYWFCAKSVNSAGESGDRCNSFTTPATAADSGTSEPAPTPAPSTSTSSGPVTEECSAAKSEWIWCDDFEQDRTSSYFEASLYPTSSVGLNGSKGLVARYPLGSAEAGNLKLAFGRTPAARFKPVDSGSKNYREVYWRVFVKNEPNWIGGAGFKLSRATVLAGSNWQQAMIAHVWGESPTSSYKDHLKIDPASGTDSSGNLRTTRYNDFSNLNWLGARRSAQPITDKDSLGKWQCLEARVRLNEAGKSNGIFELWQNGELVVARADLNWLGRYDAYGINAVFLENYWNGGSPVEQERYMDNFIVSTAPIGCGNPN